MRLIAELAFCVAAAATAVALAGIAGLRALVAEAQLGVVAGGESTTIGGVTQKRLALFG